MENLESFASLFVVSNVAVSAAYFGYWWLKGDIHYWRDAGIPYEPRRNTFQIYRDQLFKDDHDLEMERVRKYGKVYGYFEHEPNLIVCDPPLLATILNNADVFPFRRVFEYPQPVFEYIIPTLNGMHWDRVRKSLTHAFTTSNLKTMVPSIHNCAESLVNRLRTCCEEDNPADCKKLFGDFAMDVLARCAFSINTDAQKNPNDPFVYHARNAFGKYAALKTLGFFILPAFMRDLLGVHFLNAESVNFFKDIMMRELRVRENKEQMKDFLDVMTAFYDKGLELHREDEIKRLKEMRSQIEQGIPVTFKDYSQDQDKLVVPWGEVQKYLTYDELVAQSVMFFIVGYETIVSLMCFLAYNLARHPEVQEKLIKEIDEELSKKAELTYDDVKDMPYLKMVVNETLRFQPPTIKAERTAVRDYKVPGMDFTIEKGTVVGYSIYVIHRDPEYYPEPDIFDPERFSNDKKMPPCSFIPFGHGRRNCMGEPLAVMEAKHCIIKILRNFRFRTCDSTTIPMKYVKNQGLLSPRDCMLEVEKREDLPEPRSLPGPSGV